MVAIAGFAAGRMAFGAGLVAVPERIARGWIGEDAKRPAVKVAVRAIGARDIALAAGTLTHARDPGSVRPWLLAAIACDCADLAATFTAGDVLPPRARAGTALLAGASALTGALLVWADAR
jgi:hypothetical protein